jgi:RcsF protein
LTVSCSNRYVSTNLDKDNFNQYFSASNVKIYKSENDFPGQYHYIGAVEGQDCQVKPHHAQPDEINARTQARQKAFSLQANAIVFTACTLLTQEQLLQLSESNDAKQCNSLVVCYGKAYAVDTATNENN